MLKETDKDNLQVSEEGKFFTVERGQDENRVVVFLNFEGEDKTAKIPANIGGVLTKILDSTDFRKSEIADSEKVEISANNEISVQKKSIVIFSK